MPFAANNALGGTPTASVSTIPFMQQIETVLEKYLNQSGNPSALKIEIQPAPSQNSGTRQFLVTIQPPAAVSGSSEKLAAATEPLALAPTAPAPAQGNVSATPPQNYVNVPFGNGVSTVPTLAVELAAQYAMMQSPMMTRAAILNQDKVSAAGDPMAGQTVQDTTLKWDDLTQAQQLAYMYASNYGLPQGQTMQQFLEANVGPHIMANAPSTNPMLFEIA